MNITPAQNSAIKVTVNFLAVVLAVWTADLSMTAYKNYQARKASSGESAPAGNGGGAPPSSQGAGK